MKCYSGEHRGILLSSNTLKGLRVPVVFDESLLREPTARFGEELVFADAQKRDGKIILSAEQKDDGQAFVAYQSVEGLSVDDLNDEITYQIDTAGATILHNEDYSRYLGFGTYCSSCIMLLVMPAGSSATLTISRKYRRRPGLFAWLGGARAWTEELTKKVRLNYDGNEVTKLEEPEVRRTVDAQPTANMDLRYLKA